MAVAVAAALAPGAPTVLAPVNTLLRVVLATVVVLAAARARHVTVLVLAGTAAIAGVQVAGGSPATVAGWLALAIALAAVVRGVRAPWPAAVSAALGVTTLLHLGPGGPHGATAIVTALAVGPVLWSGYRCLPPPARRRVRQAAAAAGGATSLAVLGAAVAAFIGPRAAGDGMALARAGMAAARSGDGAGASSQLDAARAAFGHADASFGAWYAKPALAVPVLGQQLAAAGGMASAAYELTTVASESAVKADIQRIRVDGGRVHLARIAALEAPLTDVRAALGRASSSVAGIEPDWLAPPVRARYDELAGEVAEADRQASVALDAVRLVPAMLGAQGERRYFVAFTTPAEARGLGGFMGNWAELTAVNGHLELTRAERTDTLKTRKGDPPRTLDAPADYARRWGPNRPQDQVQDVTLSPDFPSVAAALAGVYPQTRGGRPIDGVIALDPHTVAAMLRLTGPIPIPGLDTALTADNAADFLLRRQYLEFHDNEQRADLLDEASRRAFEAFIRRDSVKPAQLASALGPMVEQRRLMLHSVHDAEQRLIERLGLAGAFPRAGAGELFGLVTQNGGNNKIDTFLRREVDYRAEWHPGTGLVDATVTVTLHNDAPQGGLPFYVIGNRASSGQPEGVNWLWFNFYTPDVLTELQVDGVPVTVGRLQELGARVYHRYLAVPPRGSTVVRMRLHGRVPAGDTFRVAWFQQPLVHPDRVTVSVRPIGGWAVRDRPVDMAGAATVAGDGRRDGAVTVTAVRGG